VEGGGHAGGVGVEIARGRAGGCTGELMGWRVELEGKRRKGKDEEGH
jgi:hypothetical protein